MDIEINEAELEMQRRQSILDSGKYIRFEMIIGQEKVEINGHNGYMPATIFELKHISSKDISHFYLCIEEFVKYLEKEYPAECLAGKLMGTVSNLGDFEYDQEEEK